MSWVRLAGVIFRIVLVGEDFFRAMGKLPLKGPQFLNPKS